MIVHDIQNSCSPVKILMGFFISSAVLTGYYYTIIGHKQYTSKSNSIFNSKVGRIGLFPFTAPFKKHAISETQNPIDVCERTF